MHDPISSDPEPIELKTGQNYEFLYWLLVLACGSIAYLSLCFATFWFCRNSSEDTSRGIAVIVAGGVASLLPFLVATIYYGPRAFLTVKIFADRILIDRDGKQTQVGLHETSRLALIGLPGLGRWLTLQLKDGGRIRISATVLGMEILVRTLVAANPSLLSAAESEALQAKLRLSDFRTIRTWEKLRNGWSILTRHIFFPVAIGVVLPNFIMIYRNHGILLLLNDRALQQLGAQVPLVVIAAAVISLPISLTAKKMLTQHERRMPFGKLARDSIFEVKVRRTADLAYYLLTCAAFATFFSFVSLTY